MTRVRGCAKTLYFLYAPRTAKSREKNMGPRPTALDADDSWADDHEEVLAAVQNACINSAEKHRVQYFHLQGYLKYFRVPSIILSTVASVMSVGLQPYAPQKDISLVTCVIMLCVGILNSLELYLKIQPSMENELMSYKDYYMLANEISKTLVLRREHRTMDGSAYIEEKFGVFMKLMESAQPLRNRTRDPFRTGELNPGAKVIINGTQYYPLRPPASSANNNSRPQQQQQQQPVPPRPAKSGRTSSLDSQTMSSEGGGVLAAPYNIPAFPPRPDDHMTLRPSRLTFAAEEQVGVVAATDERSSPAQLLESILQHRPRRRQDSSSSISNDPLFTEARDRVQAAMEQAASTRGTVPPNRHYRALSSSSSAEEEKEEQVVQSSAAADDAARDDGGRDSARMASSDESSSRLYRAGSSMDDADGRGWLGNVAKRIFGGSGGGGTLPAHYVATPTATTPTAAVRRRARPLPTSYHIGGGSSSSSDEFPAPPPPPPQLLRHTRDDVGVGVIINNNSSSSGGSSRRSSPAAALRSIPPFTATATTTDQQLVQYQSIYQQPPLSLPPLNLAGDYLAGGLQRPSPMAAAKPPPPPPPPASSTTPITSVQYLQTSSSNDAADEEEEEASSSSSSSTTADRN